ncbi:uncharacterized protein LACBIDRAFT_330347 [Laccaria bicolor S238N-H82]|uniref:Predicted protein n=1 Tax=Laccaria bicolor (strain S238N-H82 / ATCC MYA-4686) TaxID=486041 RepID=B0DL08_LACBS|nr:uncharacterized protein LACBIDRAFT_330347 [Laccaria bicolor S238N-H82]EDR04742.1 predicted protein [Laccaria bicolor S238N-H82]|eukprot:XP_001884566.1 predicted protein [Laccaria bicolor S238N-H82]
MLAQDPNFPDNLDIRPSNLNDIARQSTDSERVFGIEAQEDAIRLYGIARRVWEAAYTLSAYVSTPSDRKIEPPFVWDAARIHPVTMIELGSDSGLVASGIIKTLEPRDLFIATDLPEVYVGRSMKTIEGLADNVHNAPADTLSKGETGPGKCRNHQMLHWKREAIRSSGAFATQRQTLMGRHSNELVARCWWALVCQKVDKQLQADGSNVVNAY